MRPFRAPEPLKGLHTLNVPKGVDRSHKPLNGLHVFCAYLLIRQVGLITASWFADVNDVAVQLFAWNEKEHRGFVWVGLLNKAFLKLV